MNPLPLQPPFVSIIVPVYNDEKGIKDTLSSLSNQDYPADRWELVVVDNNSGDNTRNVALSFKELIPGLQVLSESRQSSYAARNTGIAATKGEIIAFIDADITVGSDWIRIGVNDILEQGADYVGCRVDIYPRGPHASVAEIYNQVTGFPIKKYMQESFFAPTAGLFVRKDVLDHIGLFNDDMTSGGDCEFGRRVHVAGFKQYYSDHNVMHHPARTFKDLAQKAYRTGKGNAVLQVHNGWPIRTIVSRSFRFLFPPRWRNVVHFMSKTDTQKLRGKQIQVYCIIYAITFAYHFGILMNLTSALKDNIAAKRP